MGGTSDERIVHNQSHRNRWSARSNRSEDGLLDMKLALPRELGGKGDATNPETLFAGGYAACFGDWTFRRLFSCPRPDSPNGTTGPEPGARYAYCTM